MAKTNDDQGERKKDEKRAFVVKLGQEDRDRLDYLADMTNLTKTTVVRSLIREASEGNVPGKRMSFKFTPFTECNDQPVSPVEEEQKEQ